MIFTSTLILDEDDLLPTSRKKEIKDIVPSDFKDWNTKNLIKVSKLVLYNAYGKTGSDPISTTIFKSEYTVKGTIKI